MKVLGKLCIAVIAFNQTDVTSNVVTFRVDALVDLTVTGTGGVNVTPGQTDAVLEFTVTNTGNETYDFALASEAGTENFSVTGLPGTTLNDIVADASTKVWLVGNIPVSATDNQTAAYRLMATALLSDGSPIPAEATDVVTTKQYELIFTAQTASLTITKSSTVIWDPVNLATNPLHIPGAIVEYSIQIANASGAETADAIVLTDTLDSNLSLPADPARQYVAGSSIQLTSPNLYGGVATNLTDISDADEGSVSGQTVTVTGIVLSGGETATVKVLAEIQ